MTENQYIKLTNYIKEKRKIMNILIFLCDNIPKLIVTIYCFSIIYLWINKDVHVYKFAIIPALNLIFVSLFRKIINRRRPYEVYNYEPIGKYRKDKGQSFPSRHTSSGVIIAIACYHINPVFGIIMWSLAIIVAATRILCGVHYPGDVFSGIIISILFGVIGF